MANRVVVDSEGGNTSRFGIQSFGQTLLDMQGADWAFYQNRIFNGDDTMTGSYQADNLVGYAGDDILMGGKGDKENYDVSSTPYPSPTPSTIRTAGQTVTNPDFFVDDGDDTLDGEDGNDTLDGGTGNDSLLGGAGNDVLYGGGTGDDTLDGGTGDDALIGSSGNDRILGGDGADTAVFSVASASITVAQGTNGLIVTSADGVDTIADDVESLQFSDQTLSYAQVAALAPSAFGPTAYSLYLDDTQVLSGPATTARGTGYAIYDPTAVTLSYAVTITGIDFGTLLSMTPSTAGTGDDATNAHFHAALAGSNGGVAFAFLNDDDLTAVMNGDGSWTLMGLWEAGEGLSAYASVLEAATPGTDTGLYVNVHTTSYGSGEIRGQMLGIADNSANTVTGTPGNDSLFGLGGDDALLGFAGNDVLDGGTGNDTMTGGAGDDVYDIDSADDVVVEAANEGTDTINYAGPSSNYTMAANVENLNIDTSVVSYLDIGDNALDNVIDGGVNEAPGSEVFVFGGAGGNDLLRNARFLFGGDGNDTLIATAVGGEQLSGNGGNDSIVGGAGNEIIWGGSGNDTLHGNAGNDSMYGGTGDDIFYINDADDIVVEAANEGTDTINYAGPSDSYTMAANVENLNIDGSVVSYLDLVDNALDNVIDGGGLNAAFIFASGGNDTISNAGFAFGGDGDDVINGSAISDQLAGDAGNDLINGGSAAEQISGGSGNDTLYGGAGADTLDGGDNRDTLNGGEGIDSMVGGKGYDTYYVDRRADKTIELADEGNDTVISTVSWDLSANVEHLTLAGTDDLFGNGNNLANTIIGNSGNNVLNGDIGLDELFGGAGDDSLNGGQGGDRMYGGLGDDTFVVGSVRDVVFENADEGIDLVRIRTKFTLGDNFENLEMAGSGRLRGTGNALDNVMTGNDGANKLYGMAGNDTLFGGAGADIIDGGTGSDMMVGGIGKDFYYVDSATDIIVELADGGNDKAFSTATYSLAENVEKLKLVGGQDIDGHGNALNNQIAGNGGDNLLGGGAGNDTLKGNDGKDILDGGAGNDLLYGGKGADVFVFAASNGNDTVFDFKSTFAKASGHDVLQFVSNGEISDFAGFVAASSQVGSAVVYDFGNDGLNTITLNNNSLLQMQATDFDFII